MYLPEPLIAQNVKDGRVRLVFGDWSPSEPDFHIYCFSRPQMSTGLIIDLVSELESLGL